MSGWVNARAREQVIFNQESGELWRKINDSFSSAVSLLNSIYFPQQRVIEKSACPATVQYSCLRVRKINTVGESVDTYIEVKLLNESRQIICTGPGITGAALSVEVQGTGLIVKRSGGDGQTVLLPDDVCRLYLEPFIAKLGIFTTPMNFRINAES